MLRIYIARHGQNADNEAGILNGHRDLPLTELGIEQAARLAQHMMAEGLAFDAVFSSPLCRAFDTAQVVTRTLGIDDPVKLDLLIERDFGTMTGMPVADIPVLCDPDDIIATETITYFLAPEGAETFPELVERGRRMINRIGDAFPNGGSVLLVCHGDIGKMIYAAYHGLDWKSVLTDFHFGNSELLLLSEGVPPGEAHVFKQDQFNH